MTTLREAAQQALEALQEYQSNGAPFLACDGAIAALRAALAQQDEPVLVVEKEPDYWSGGHFHQGNKPHIDPTKVWSLPIGTPLYLAPPQRKPQTLDESMRLPRALAQAYENGYNAGVAHEREACAKVCEARFMGDLTREDMEARRCAAAIRARGGQT